MNLKKTTVRLKDITTMTMSDEDRAAIDQIASKFSQGESTKQEAFDGLVGFCVHKLEPYVEERKSGLKLVQGALKKLAKLMEGTVLDTLGLTSTYCQPARQMARAVIEGTTDAFKYVIDNLTEVGNSEAGDLPGPIFAPSRLIVSMKTLREEKDNPFEVDVDPNTEEETLFLRDKVGNRHRFGSLSIEGIKDILRTGQTDPETLDLLNTLLGQFTKKDEREKPGTVLRAIDKVREAAKSGTEPDSFALDLCASIEDAILTAREALIKRNRDLEVERRASEDMERAQKRLERRKELGLLREEGESILAGN